MLQGTGNFAAFPVLIALLSPQLCKHYLCSEDQADGQHGLIRLSGFLYFWGWLSLGLAGFVWLAQPETIARVAAADAESSVEREKLALRRCALVLHRVWLLSGHPHWCHSVPSLLRQFTVKSGLWRSSPASAR